MGFEKVRRIYCGVFCSKYCLTNTRSALARSARRLQSLDNLYEIDDYEQPIPRRTVDTHTSLISLIPSKSLIILLHARGNFEGIYPRPFVLRNVRKLIEEERWGEAFGVCKRMKVGET